ncbi:hypothetical protein BMAFMH_I0048 [Burkholderia mallei FMH]|nr:hypothetical protein BMAFMH_I0048 [Burkholderia mallei FMH]
MMDVGLRLSVIAFDGCRHAQATQCGQTRSSPAVAARVCGSHDDGASLPAIAPA